METHKTSKNDFLASQNTSFVSPLHKEAKKSNCQVPGNKYFNFINAEERQEEIKNLKKMNDVNKKIENARFNFQKIMDKMPSIKSKDFIAKAANLKQQLNSIKDIPNLKTIKNLHQKYCEDEISRKNFKNRNWNEFEVKLLTFMLVFVSSLEKKTFENFDEDNWQEITTVFINKNSQICKFKYNALLRSHPTVFPWTSQEDEFLKQIVSSQYNDQELYKVKWGDIAIKLNSLSGNAVRIGKHCRERYLNYLNPSLNKGPWTPEEDLILLENILNHGRKWAQIAREIPGRNENSAKNRFITLSKNIGIKSRKKSDLSLNNHLLILAIHEMISKLKKSIEQKIIDTSLENLELESPKNKNKTQMKNLEFESPTKRINIPSLENIELQNFENKNDIQNMDFEEQPPSLILSQPQKSLAEQRSDFIQKLQEDKIKYEKKESFLIKKYANYLRFSNFINSNIATPFPNLENQFKELKKEIKKVNEKHKELNLSHLHFTSSHDTERRGSGSTSKAPESKRPSNNYTSIILTNSILASEPEETSAENDNNILEEQKCLVFPTPDKPTLNKKQLLFGFILDDIRENQFNNDNYPFTHSVSNKFSDPTPPILSYSNASPIPMNSFEKDFFRFSPLNEKKKFSLSPVYSLEDEGFDNNPDIIFGSQMRQQYN